MNKLLSSIFFDPSHPASFSGPQKLYDAAVKQDSTVTLNGVKSWLSGEETYTFHKPSRKKFKRNKVIVGTIDQQWDVDLMDMTKIAKYNDGYHFILLAVDIFSRYVWTVPLRDKSGNEVVRGFTKIFKERVPEVVRSDKGTEFLGHKVQNLFKSHLIRHFVTQNEVKANYAERAIKTIKGKIYKYFTYKQSYRYIDALQDFTRAYNSSVHRSIKMAPAQVTMNNLNSEGIKNEERMKKTTFKFKVGDFVRISRARKTFTREYDQRWSGELFQIVNRDGTQRYPTYKIKDYAGESIDGTFYEEELQKVTPNEYYKVEKILKSRKIKGRPKEVLVRWLHWPPKYDSWIPATDITSFYK